MKVELNRRIKALKANELINHSHPLFIGNVFSREAGYERGEIGNRAKNLLNSALGTLLTIRFSVLPEKP